MNNKKPNNSRSRTNSPLKIDKIRRAEAKIAAIEENTVIKEVLDIYSKDLDKITPNKNNELIGTVGYSERGTPTNLQGRAVGFNASGQPVDFSSVNANETGQETDIPVSPTAPVTCPDGYVYDSITNSCVAVESTAEETETTEASPIVVDPNVTVPTEYPLFNQGGVASLNDVARNMSRGPRGIAGYQTYMR